MAAAETEAEPPDNIRLVDRAELDAERQYWNERITAEMTSFQAKVLEELETLRRGKPEVGQVPLSDESSVESGGTGALGREKTDFLSWVDYVERRIKAVEERAMSRVDGVSQELEQLRNTVDTLAGEFVEEHQRPMEAKPPSSSTASGGARSSELRRPPLASIDEELCLSDATGAAASAAAAATGISSPDSGTARRGQAVEPERVPEQGSSIGTSRLDSPRSAQFLEQISKHFTEIATQLRADIRAELMGQLQQELASEIARGCASIKASFAEWELELQRRSLPIIEGMVEAVTAPLTPKRVGLVSQFKEVVVPEMASARVATMSAVPPIATTRGSSVAAAPVTPILPISSAIASQRLHNTSPGPHSSQMQTPVATAPPASRSPRLISKPSGSLLVQSSPAVWRSPGDNAPPSPVRNFRNIPLQAVSFPTGAVPHRRSFGESSAKRDGVAADLIVRESWSAARERAA